MLSGDIEPPAGHIERLKGRLSLITKLPEDLKAEVVEEAKWSYEAYCGPHRMFQDSKAGDLEHAKLSYCTG